jgi:hypothetical protein
MRERLIPFIFKKGNVKKPESKGIKPKSILPSAFHNPRPTDLSLPRCVFSLLMTVLGNFLSLWVCDIKGGFAVDAFFGPW